MQIVIDIPEEDYNFVKKQVADGITNPLKICIANGTPLPKGHGRLIDADDIALIDEQFYVPSDYYVAESAIDEAPTIIEADKAESEDKCENCKYSCNPDYTRCHECKAESEEQA